MQRRRFLRDIFVSCLFALLVLEGGGSLYATRQAENRFVYEGEEYCISLFGIRLDMEKLGLCPVMPNTACHRGYIATFGLDGDKLVLTNLFTNNGRGEPVPTINGVQPTIKEERGQGNDLEYKNINLPIRYTGAVFLKEYFILEGYTHAGLQSSIRIDGYVESVGLMFENGILKSKRDWRSEKDRLQEVAAIEYAQSILVAAMKKDVEVIKSFVSEGVDVNIKDENDRTPLHVAAATEKENIEIVKFLVSKGADVNAETFFGETPLTEAVFRGNGEVAKFLISQGADVNAKNAPFAPLYTAACYVKDADVVKYLVSKGANVNTPTRVGKWYPLHGAACNKNSEVAEFIVSQGAEVNVKNERGETPLHRAAETENIEVLKFFVSIGADVNAKIDDDDKLNSGWTPLHFAAEKGNVEAVKILVSNGADIDVKVRYVLWSPFTEKRGTPLDIAKDKGHTAVVEYLSSLK